jgi:hypothetical protein
MSQKKFAIAYFVALSLGLMGVWLLSIAIDIADLRFWVSLILFSSALVILFVLGRDLRPSAEEQSIAWKRLKSKGRIRYVLSQVLLSQMVWLPILFFRVTAGAWRLSFVPPTWWVVLAVMGVPIALVYSRIWWAHQERKYDAAHYVETAT